MEAMKKAEEILKLLGNDTEEQKALILALVRMALSEGKPNSRFGINY